MKTNPVPLGAHFVMHSTSTIVSDSIAFWWLLEKILDQDPLVISSVMFGQGRFNAGVLVDPISEQKLDSVDTTFLEEFRNKIWSALPCHRYLILLTLLRTGPQCNA